MADRQRNIEVKFRINAEGQREVFRQMAEDVNDFGQAGETAADKVAKLQAAVERGGNVSTKALAGAKLAIDDYRDALERAEQAGAQIGEKEREQLEALEDAYDNAASRAGEFAAAQQQAKRDLDDATEAAGGQVESINSLQGAMKKLAEETGNLGLLMKANLIASLVELAGEINGKLVDALNEGSKALGGQGDEFKLVGGIIPVYQKGIDDVAESLANLVEGIDDSNEALARQKKELEAYDEAQRKFLEARKKAAEEEKKAAEDKKKAEEEAAKAAEKRRQEEEKAEQERQKAKEKADKEAAEAAERAAKKKEDEAKRAAEAGERAAEAAKKAAEAAKPPEAGGWKPYVEELDSVVDANERVVESSSRAALSVAAVLNGEGSMRDLLSQGRGGNANPQLPPESSPEQSSP